VREEGTAERIRQRIHYPSGSWFPLKNEVFGSVFPKLREHRSRQLYLAMYEYVQRPRPKPLMANLNDLSEMINCDPRTARRCVVELVGEGLVTVVDEGGRLRSREKATFAVPLAKEELNTGHWFPVPRFLVTHYSRTFPGSVVLISLLYHQHMKWRPYCWPGVKKLVSILGMKPRSIYDSLNKMGHETTWKRLGTNLPRPLQIRYSPDGKHRRFVVRAAEFYVPPGRNKPVVKLSEEFAIHFGYQRTTATANDEDHDLRS
jgi:hypothetical protein